MNETETSIQTSPTASTMVVLTSAQPVTGYAGGESAPGLFWKGPIYIPPSGSNGGYVPPAGGNGDNG